MNPKLAYCHVVASVLAADGVMAQDERSFLARVMEEAQLTSDERDQVMHFEGTDRAEDVVRGLPSEEREKLRDDVLAATLVDGNISPLESRLIKHLTEVLDL